MRNFTSEENEDEGGGVWIVEDRPPLRDGKVFVDFDERATIAESLEAAYLALDHAFRGITIEKALELGGVSECWDDGDINELEALPLEAMQRLNEPWRALSAVVEALTAGEMTGV